MAGLSRRCRAHGTSRGNVSARWRGSRETPRGQGTECWCCSRSRFLPLAVVQRQQLGVGPVAQPRVRRLPPVSVCEQMSTDQELAGSLVCAVPLIRSSPSSRPLPSDKRGCHPGRVSGASSLHASMMSRSSLPINLPAQAGMPLRRNGGATSPRAPQGTACEADVPGGPEGPPTLQGLLAANTHPRCGCPQSP